METLALSYQCMTPMGPYEICAQPESFMGAAVHKTGNNGSNQKWVLKMGVPSGKQDYRRNNIHTGIADLIADWMEEVMK